MKTARRVGAASAFNVNEKFHTNMIRKLIRVVLENNENFVITFVV